ncbi:MAG: M12 family metallo-peptidase, partial [Bacteroidota bacterium]
MRPPLPLLSPLFFCFFGLFHSVNLFGQISFSAPTTPTAYSAPLLSQLVDYELVRLSPEELFPSFNEQQGTFMVSLLLGRTAVNPQLQRWELRSPNYQRSNGVRATGVTSQSTQYRGQLPGEKRGSAIFTVSPDFVLGSWEVDGEKYTLEPLWLNTPEAPKDLYVWYRDQDLKSPEAKCSVGGKELLTESVAPAAKNVPGGQQVELAVAMDNELYRTFTDEGRAENWVLGILALVQGDYDRGFDDRVQFRLSNLFLSTGEGVPEPWSGQTDAQSMLNEFRIWGENQSVFTQPYDVAAFWTERDFDGNTIGYAFID